MTSPYMKRKLAMTAPVALVATLLGSTLTLAKPHVAKSHESWLQARGVQSEAVCIDQFSWMANAQEQSPCLAAAWLLGSCQNGGESPF